MVRAGLACVVCGALMLVGGARAWSQGPAPQGAPEEAASPSEQEAAPPTVQPTDAQVQLYEKAFEAFQQEDFPKAIELLRSALTLGELNIIYLNLGRAYFRNGQCAEAEDTYAKARKAPQVAEPSPAEVQGKLDSFRKDLDKGCPGVLVVKCEPAGMQVRLDGGPPQACGELLVPVGFHKVEGEWEGRTAVEVVQIQPRGRAEVSLKVERREGASPWPWLVGGAGVVLLGASLGLDLAVVGPAVEDYERAIVMGSPDEDELRADAELWQQVTLGVGASGGALLLGGLGWLAYGWLTGEEVEGQALAPWLTPNSAGASWGLAW